MDPEKPSSEDEYIPVLVTRNETRRQLEIAHGKARAEMATSEDDCPILLMAHMQVGKRTKEPTGAEKSHLRTLPDSDFNKAAPFLLSYPGSRFLVTANLNVSAGLAQGTRCRQVGWPVFPERNVFRVEEFQGVKCRLPSCDPVCVFVELTSAKLLARPVGQPSGLPPNVVALAMHLHRKSSVSFVGMAVGRTRSTVSVRLRQFPLRHGNVLTTYSAQSSQFKRFCIYETTPTEFYSQCSRGSRGLNSITIAHLKECFAPSVREATQQEMARLGALHNTTKEAFSIETAL